jgi:hypothetical protein
MGVHTGEAIQRDGDFYGRSVILAARIADRADGGEILVSSLVKELIEPGLRHRDQGGRRGRAQGPRRPPSAVPHRVGSAGRSRHERSTARPAPDSQIARQLMMDGGTVIVVLMVVVMVLMCGGMMGGMVLGLIRRRREHHDRPTSGRPTTMGRRSSAHRTQAWSTFMAWAAIRPTDR